MKRLALTALVILPSLARADRHVILGVGAAFEGELPRGGVHGGANLMLEVEAIEGWLEIEVGVSLLAADGGLELSTDLLFKKPFALSRWAEIMIGLGPTVVGLRRTSRDGALAGIEFVVDLMFWPSRHVGLWIEPAYDLLFRDGVEHSLGSSGGVLFGW